MSPDGTIATDDPDKMLKLALFSLEKAADIILWIDARARIHYANEAACQSYGYTRDELLSMAVTDLNPGYTKETWLGRWSEVKRRRSLTYETHHRRKGGTTFPVDVSISYIRFGDVEYNCACIRDITRRKQSEDALRRSESGLEKAQQIARIGSWEWDIVNNVEHTSRELLRLYDYGSDTGNVERFVDAVHPEDRERVRSSIEAAVREGKPYDINFRMVKKDGSVRYMHAMAEICLDAGGRPVRMYGIGQDVTERMLAEEALKGAKASAELYVDLMGHDLNNMHQIALGYLELARDMRPGGGEFLDKPIEVLQRSARLIMNVKKLQMLNDNTVETVPVDVARVLADVQREFGSVPDKSVILNLNGCGHCQVLANELLYDVFANLVSNAIKHTGDHAAIAIDMGIVKDHGHRYCRVAVEDDGPGIPDDFKGRIFNRMLKGTSKAKGMGLGLYLVKSLVESYDGKVRVEDRVSGDHAKGARFVVMLPAVGE